LSLSWAPIAPGFEALVFKASRGIERCLRVDLPPQGWQPLAGEVSVTALRDSQEAIIGYLLIGTDNTARKRVEAERALLDQRLRDKNAELESAKAIRAERPTSRSRISFPA
jgi:hypothetical protein